MQTETLTLTDISYTIKETCYLLKICRTTLWKEIKRGKIAVTCIGTRGKRISAKAIQDYLGY